MISLSERQLSIVQAPIGEAMQVLASAGSGKTRVLTERVRYILEHTKKDGVIALTFTNKAAEEMSSRLESVTDIEERCWIATIHALAQRILDQYGHLIGLPSELQIYERDQDRKAVFLQSLRENGFNIEEFLNGDGSKAKSREQIIQKYMEKFSIVKRELLSDEEIWQRYSGETKFLSIYHAYQSALIDSGGIDFDDILVYAHKILLEHPGCGNIYRAKYKHLCVDEAQDLNKAQYEFIKGLCGEKIKSVLMVGDPNQMIYGFNGSSHAFLCQYFVQDFYPRIIELKQNYRSSKSVIYLANKLKPGSQVESNYALDGHKEIIKHSDENAEATWICSKIKELLNKKNHSEIEGEILLTKMVVIARNRFVFKALEESLTKNEIPYALKKGERKAESDSVFGKVLDLGIRVRLNPKDWVDGKKLCSVLKIRPPERWGDIDLLNRLANEIRKSEILLPDIQADLLKAIHELDLEKPNIMKFYGKLKQIVESRQVCNEYIEEVERSLRELEEFKESWVTFRRKGLGESLTAFRNAMALGQLCDNSDQVGLTLSTVHTMKGLEKDIVFLMGMCEGVFPDYRASSKQEIEEERNNAFVAVTRARRWIYITYPLQRMMPWGDSRLQQSSRFIKEMEV